MTSSDDWRIQGQEKYLQNARLIRHAWKSNNPSNDHDHCDFCWAKFSANAASDDLREGWCTEDFYTWVCPTCYEDFKTNFGWK